MRAQNECIEPDLSDRKLDGVHARTGYSSARAPMHLPFEKPPETFQFGCSDWPKVQMS